MLISYMNVFYLIFVSAIIFLDINWIVNFYELLLVYEESILYEGY